MVGSEAVRCANCGFPLNGDYCARCGQRDRGDNPRLGELTREMFEDMGRLDGRLWLTLSSLVFRPGKLSADYFAGRRARYLPPVRLYLVVSFVVFLLISFAPIDVSFSSDPAVDLEHVEAERGKGLYVPVERESGETEVLSLEEFLREQSSSEEPNPEWLASLLERLAQNAAAVDADSSNFAEQLIQRLPQMMFFLLPLFALILQLAYLFSPFHYLQHLIFSLHFHTAAFVYLILFYPVSLLLPGDYGGVVMLVLFIYLPLAMARAYGSGGLAAVGKSLAVGLSYYFLVLLAGVIYLFVNLALV